MSLEDTDNLTVFAPTDKGRKELKSGTTALSPVALELMVMFDGKAPMAEIARRVTGPKSGEISATVEALLREKLIDLVKPGAGGAGDKDIGSLFEIPVHALPDSVAAKYREEADKGMLSLDQTGYYIGVARQALTKKAPTSGSKYSVLLIEDNVPFVTAVKMMLKLEGYEPRVASSRDEIIASLRSQPSPDVILLDVNLGGVDGFDILARMRQHPALKDIPVIMLTAQSSRRDVLRALAGGANGYITKPFDHDALVKGVSAVLGLG